MRQEVQTALQELGKLDLSTNPYEHAKRHIGQLDRFSCILVTLHQGKTIMRARPNYENERFFSKCEYTYKPQQFNKTYQRASTPHQTMFYASTIPETGQTEEHYDPRVIGAYEALSWLRDKTTKGYQKISFGRWLVTKDINLLAIVQHDAYYNQSSYTLELADAFKKFTDTTPELKDETLTISDFFAKEYAKEKINNEYDYLLSAAFTETVVENGLDGVLYPSVRVGGQGFNVAIRPETADTNLDLVVAGECSIYKYYDKTVVDNETGIELRPQQTHFELPPVDKQYHAGQEECLRRLGLKSMDELK